jgi:hypothetical protein
MKIKLRVMVTVGVLLLTATGCDDARLKAFSDFAACGSAYVAGFHSLTKAVAEAEMAKSNSILLDVRERMYTPPAGSAEEEKASQKSLQQGVETNTKILQEYLKNLRKLDAHATALGAYFKELASYTSDKNSDAISSSTQALADSIESLAPGIEKMKFGTFAVGAARTTGNLVIAHIQVKTLEKILERDLPALNKAFALQEQAVNALSEDLADSVGAATTLAEVNKVYLPYMNRGRLPSGWEAERERVIRRTVIVGNADGAKQAITELRAAFVALVENKPAPVDVHSILDAVEKMSGYAEAVQDGASSN